MTHLVAAALLFAVTLLPAPASAGGDPCPIDQTHAAWTAMLSRHVRDGVVDYAAWKRDDDAALGAYLVTLSGVCRPGYESWTSAQRIAFWIDAYNAFTVRLVLDHYPLPSIRSIGWLPGAAFRENFIPMDGLKGGTISLNDVEHGTLRTDFREPRIHFALVCASKSCPALRPEAYRGADLERQLDEQARAFLNDPTKNRFDVASRTLSLSSIFTWFHDDFAYAAGSVPLYVARYLPPDGVELARDPSVQVEYLDYDWSLNGQ